MTTGSNKGTVEFMTGDINSETGSGKVYIFHCPVLGSVREGEKETYISSAINGCSSLGSKIMTTKHPARSNIQTEIGGKVFQTSWQLEDGEIFKLFAKCKVGGWNARSKTAVLYLRVRSDGPMNRVHVKVSGIASDSVFQTWASSGRFDVISMEEAEELGVNVLENCRDHGSTSSVEALFRIETMDSELRSRATVKMKRVGDRVMPIKVRKRSLEL